MANGQVWQNRITRYGEESPDQLLANPKNWRIHPQPQQDALAGILGDVGVVQNVIVNERSGFVVDGHLRVALAMRTGQPSIPVTYVDLDDAEEALILATIDPVAAMAATDDANLAELLAMIETDNADVQALLDSLSSDVTTITEGLTDPDDVPSVPDEPATKPGDLWLLGRHRVLCGDSEDPLQFDRLMDGKTPDLLHTDPPYGISIVAPKGLAAAGQVGGSKPFGSVNNANRRNPTGFDRGVTSGVKTKPSAVFDRTLGPVQRGHKSRNQIIQANICPVIHGDDEPFEPGYLLALAPIVVLWGANYFADKLPVSSSWICWDKREGITRNSFADCELAWSSSGGPARVFHHLWNGLHKGSQHGERRTHPTEKPVALFEEIGNQYAPKGLWVDLYAGSGAQVIAAERSGATCYACEIEPLYVDVIVRRWEQFTGQTATLATEAVAA